MFGLCSGCVWVVFGLSGLWLFSVSVVRGSCGLCAESWTDYVVVVRCVWVVIGMRWGSADCAWVWGCVWASRLVPGLSRVCVWVMRFVRGL